MATSITNDIRKTLNIFEDDENNYIKQGEIFKQKVLSDCIPFLKEIGGTTKLHDYKMFRGLRDDTITTYTIGKPRLDRKPINTSTILHDATSRAMNELGIKARRDNSYFAVGGESPYTSMAEMYGYPYVVIPRGDFRFTWSKFFDDFTMDDTLAEMLRDKVLTPSAEFEEEYLDMGMHMSFTQIHASIDEKEFTINYDRLKKFIKKNYTTKNLKQAIESEHEIMITGDSYYIVENEFFDSINW